MKMARRLDGHVFGFASSGFAKMWDNHYVSTKAIPLARTEVAARIRNMGDAMRTGLQVFTVHQPHAPGELWPHNGFHGKRIPGDLAPYIGRGEVVSENYEHDIAPDPQLLKLFANVLPKRRSSVSYGARPRHALFAGLVSRPSPRGAQKLVDQVPMAVAVQKLSSAEPPRAP